MKSILLCALALIASAVVAQAYQCPPALVQDANNAFIAFNSAVFKYSIPDLNLNFNFRVLNQQLCGPATLNNNQLTFAANSENTNSTIISASDLSIISQSNSPAPYPPVILDPDNCISHGGSSYCYVYSNNAASLVRKNGNTVVETLHLPIADNGIDSIIVDPDVQGRIHVVTYNCQGRVCRIQNYYALSTNPLKIFRGPISLRNINTGCPVRGDSCAGDALFTYTVRNDIITYVWSLIESDGFQVVVGTYDARCDSFKHVNIASSLIPANRCTTPAPTANPTHNCWTCPAGFVHWYDIPGMEQPEDRCACVPTPQQHNCWTCPAGFVHWYDIPGMEQPADKCACVPTPQQHNCWTCPAGFVHWYDIPGMEQPEDRCACVRQ
jgi:hypothetical protein